MVTPAVADFNTYPEVDGDSLAVKPSFDREYWRRFFAAQLLSNIDPQTVTTPTEKDQVAEHVQAIADATLLRLERFCR